MESYCSALCFNDCCNLTFTIKHRNITKTTIYHTSLNLFGSSIQLYFNCNSLVVFVLREYIHSITKSKHALY